VQRYTYTDGDPVNLVDPTGRMEEGNDSVDRVCLGGWCVNPATATFFMERTFGYCTGAAACQLMLRMAEHEARLKNSITERIKMIEALNNGIQRAQTLGGATADVGQPPGESDARTDWGCPTGSDGQPRCPVVHLPEAVVRSQAAPTLSARATAELYVGSTWVSEFSQRYAWNRAQTEGSFSAAQRWAFKKGMGWAMRKHVVEAVDGVRLLKGARVLAGLVPEMIKDSPGALILGRAVAGEMVRTAAYQAAVIEFGWNAGLVVGAAGDAAIDASYAVTFAAIYGGLSAPGSLSP